MKRIFSRLALYGGGTTLVVAALVQPVLASWTEHVKEQAYQEALQDFEADWKKRLTKNQPLLRSACTTWWFGMNGKERRVR